LKLYVDGQYPPKYYQFITVISLHIKVHANQILRNVYTHCSLKQPVRVSISVIEN